MHRCCHSADFGCCGGFGRCDVPWLGPDPASAAPKQQSATAAPATASTSAKCVAFRPPPSPPRPAPPRWPRPATAAAPSLESDSSRRNPSPSRPCSPKRVAVCCCRLFKVTPLKSDIDAVLAPVRDALAEARTRDGLSDAELHRLSASAHSAPRATASQRAGGPPPRNSCGPNC
uniref:Uncharacterized protein n=1 Tax=Macrostomum lignano TaxID=282301 RepID=A0A1I8FPX2_9PLAT